MKYVFMNHRIRDEKPAGPVIVVQEQLTSDGPSQREADEFEITYHGQPLGRIKFSPKGLVACDTHHVRAWVELEDDVDVVAVAKASEKKARRKVKVAK